MMHSTPNRPPHRRRRGMRQDQLDLANTLRDKGMTWIEIAAAFRERFRVSALVATRLAHGWSQRDVADLWNRQWPDDPKTFKNISYWENWPSATGYSPSLTVLGRLAELYSCAITDLLLDGPDFRRRDPNYGARLEFDAAPTPHALAAGLEAMLDKLAESHVEEIAGVGLLWADRMPMSPDSYALLQKLSAGLALAATLHARFAPPRTGPPPDEAPAPYRDDLAGIWRGSFDAPDAALAGEHFMLFRRHRGRLVGQSLPHPTGARIRLDLEQNGSVVFGTWVEHSLVGRAATWCGTVRFEVDHAARTMRGRWLGFGDSFAAKAGDWRLSWVQDGPLTRTAFDHHGWYDPASLIDSDDVADDDLAHDDLAHDDGSDDDWSGDDGAGDDGADPGTEGDDEGEGRDRAA